MTTAELHGLFPVRPLFGEPVFATCQRIDGRKCEERAITVWGEWWWGSQTDAGEEARVWQVTDLLQRAAGLLEIEAARLTLAAER